MVSRFQPSRLLGSITLFALLGAVSFFINPEPWRHLSPATMASFGGSAIVLLGIMLLLRRRMWLRLDHRGIEVKYAVGAPRFFAWDNIVSADIGRKKLLLLPLLSTVRLRLRSGAASRAGRAAALINGYDASFPGFFDLSAEEILERIEFHLSQQRSGG